MKFSRNLKFFLLFVLILLIVAPVHAYKKIKLYMPEAPELQLGDASTIAVLDFKPANMLSEEAGKFIADKMIEYFLMEDRGIREIKGGLFSSDTKGTSMIEGLSTKCFKVVERSRLEAVLNEQEMTDIGLVDDAEAARIGQLLGVDVMLYGEVSDFRKDTKKFETRTVNKKKVKVKCVLREVSVTASIRFVDSRTGEIIGTKRITKTQRDKKCDGDRSRLKDKAEMAALCANQIAWEFTNLINPWYARSVFELEKIKTDEFEDRAHEAAEAAEDLELGRAFAIYKDLYDSDPYNPKFLYNLGVLYEITGDFENAQEMYNNALMLKDEGKYKDAVERNSNRLYLISFYSNLGMEIVPFDFEKAAHNSSLAAVKLEVKGGSDDRIAVYAQANSSSNVQAKVPGGIQLEMIDQQGEWYHVKLLGNKEGFIHKDKVKN